MYFGKPVNPDQESDKTVIKLTNCREKCLEDCRNNGDWKYFDGGDPENEWLADLSLSLAALDGNGISEKAFSYLQSHYKFIAHYFKVHLYQTLYAWLFQYHVSGRNGKRGVLALQVVVGELKTFPA